MRIMTHENMINLIVIGRYNISLPHNCELDDSSERAKGSAQLLHMLSPRCILLPGSDLGLSSLLRGKARLQFLKPGLFIILVSLRWRMPEGVARSDFLSFDQLRRELDKRRNAQQNVGSFLERRTRDNDDSGTPASPDDRLMED
jgi:hypothetical protein